MCVRLPVSPYFASPTRAAHWWQAWALVLAVVWVLVGPVMAQSLPASPKKQVLFLFSNDRLLPANVEADRGFRQAIQQSPFPIELYSEFLDAIRFPETADQEEMELYLRTRYAGHPPEVVIVGGAQALQFMMARRKTLFPGVTLLYIAADVGAEQAAGLPPGIVGIRTHWHMAETMEMILRLQPSISRIVVITGSSLYDRGWETRARQEFAPFSSRVRLDWWSAWPVERILAEITRLPRGTAVFYGCYFQSPDGASYVPARIIGEFTRVSSVPVFGLNDTYLAGGITGGVISPFEDQGRAGGELLLRVLQEPSMALQPLQIAPGKAAYFNAPALERYHISERSLPAGAVVLNRKPSLWQEHRTAVLWTLAVILVQSILIAALLWMRSRAIRGEKELRLSEERFSKAFETRPTALAILRTADFMCLDVNEMWCEQFGYTRSEVIGRGAGQLQFFAEEADQELFHQRLARQETVQGLEVPLRTKTGHIIQSRVYVEHIDLNGHPCHIVVQQDITAQKLAEELRGQLDHVARLATVGEFTASLAHEFNQPLGAILCNVDAAETMLDQPEAPFQEGEFRDILADVRACVNRAGEVITSIRGLARKQKLALAPLDLNRTIRDVLHIAQPLADRRKTVLGTQLADGLPQVLADGAHLQQVLLNLIINALEAMTPGEGATRHVTIRTAHSGESVHVLVEDSGPGLPEEILPHIFESFYTTKKEGMGLGLAMARSIVEAHGGKIRAANRESSPGAVFEIALVPAKDQQNAA